MHCVFFVKCERAQGVCNAKEKGKRAHTHSNYISSTEKNDYDRKESSKKRANKRFAFELGLPLCFELNQYQLSVVRCNEVVGVLCECIELIY